VKEATLKRLIERLRPVFDEGGSCGALVHSAKGWAAHNTQGNRIGLFPGRRGGCEAAGGLGRGPINIRDIVGLINVRMVNTEQSPQHWRSHESKVRRRVREPRPAAL
jgi:hypothetical protein